MPCDLTWFSWKLNPHQMRIAPADDRAKKHAYSVYLTPDETRTANVYLNCVAKRCTETEFLRHRQLLLEAFYQTLRHGDTRNMEQEHKPKSSPGMSNEEFFRDFFEMKPSSKTP